MEYAKQGIRVNAVAPDVAAYAHLNPVTIRFDFTSGLGRVVCNAQASDNPRNNRYLPLARLLNLQKLLNFRQGDARPRAGSAPI